MFALAAALATLAVPTQAAPAPLPVLRLDGIGPLKIGMTRTAAVRTGWVTHPRHGCPLGGHPYPIDYRLSGAKAPAGLGGTVEFRRGRLRAIQVDKGATTKLGTVVGQTTYADMITMYVKAGFTASAAYEPAFEGSFITVQRSGRTELTGFAPDQVVTELGVPALLVCE